MGLFSAIAKETGSSAASAALKTSGKSTLKSTLKDSASMVLSAIKKNPKAALTGAAIVGTVGTVGIKSEINGVSFQDQLKSDVKDVGGVVGDIGATVGGAVGGAVGKTVASAATSASESAGFSFDSVYKIIGIIVGLIIFYMLIKYLMKNEKVQKSVNQARKHIKNRYESVRQKVNDYKNKRFSNMPSFRNHKTRAFNKSDESEDQD